MAYQDKRKLLDRIALSIAIATIAIGLSVMLGWLTGIPLLINFTPRFVAMKFNTALCFVLQGMALLFMLRSRESRMNRNAALSCSLAVISIGLASFIEYAANVDLGIDNFFVTEKEGALYTSYPGRMSIVSAAGFFLISSAMLLVALKEKAMAASSQIILFVAGVLSYQSILAYFLGATDILVLGMRTTAMAPNTTTLFLLLVMGVLSARMDYGVMPMALSDSDAGKLFRRLFSFGVLLPPALGFIDLMSDKRGWTSNETGIALVAVSNVALFVVVLVIAASRIYAEGELRRAAGDLLRESEVRFRTIMDELDALVYVADMETYETLFINRYGIKVFGDITGKTCWQYLQMGQDGPCPFCTNKHLLDDEGNPRETYRSECLNTFTGRWYAASDRAIRWTDGRTVRMEIAKDITTLKEIEAALTASNEAKTMLMKEVHHRVKNNLTVLQSLLSLQMKDIMDEKDKVYFDDIRNRVRSMTMIHERLHGSGDLKNIGAGEYIRSLADMLFKNYATGGNVRLSYDIQDAMIDVDTMIPLGLIINELVSNALKYAFPDGREGELKISFTKPAERACLLVIRDNGVGLPKGFDISQSTSLGLMIVKSLADQLEGELVISGDNGAEFRVRFKDRSALSSI